MPTDTMFRSPALANCPVCSGTGHDEAFNSPCNCTKMIGTGSFAARSAANPATAPAQHSTGSGTGTGTAKPQRTNAYPGRCAVCKAAVPANEGRLVKEGQGWAVKCADGACRTIAGPPAAAQAAPHRTNRFAQNCHHCGISVPADTGILVRVDNNWTVEHEGGCPTPVVSPVAAVGLDLTALPHTGDTVYFGVPSMDTRLKVRVRFPQTGTWAGWVFVDDGAEYGYGRKYGKQAPGARYVGDIEAELAAILTDPQGALAKYGAITDHCGVCNRPLEDAVSVARGIGPVCYGRLGF